MESRTVFWLYLLFVSNFMKQLVNAQELTDNEVYSSSDNSDDDLMPSQPQVRKDIVTFHNYFRTKVQPTASNMLLMTWHPEAAEQAQIYADKCIPGHNTGKERTVSSLGNCGQNLARTSVKKPWFFVLDKWFDEYQNFTYGAPVKNFKAVGHYTQMVWATSYKVGCGVARCSGGPWGEFYNYVCHYCPAGNYVDSKPFPYKSGKPCADCPNDCVWDSLCTNSCPYTDFYGNCNKLATFPNYCEKGTCKATCNCGSKKIYKNYPWN